ncbi:MAG: cytochrome c [Cyanobacteria bacterium HKST-UBA02]|nr:cytochrome c [Cyanobacteria bacterium HKST-UBA02]
MRTSSRLFPVSFFALSILSLLTIVPAAASKPYKPAPETALAKQGKKYVEMHKCSLCHTAGGQGGCLAPPFDGIGARRSEDFLVSRISDSKGAVAKFARQYGEYELMPHLRIPDKQARAIAAYLMTVPEPEGGFKIVGHGLAGQKKKEMPGRALVAQKGCLACHSLGGIGGSFAPALDGVGGRRTRESIDNHILGAEMVVDGGGEYGNRGAVMPPSGLSRDEIEAIADYLETLK